MDTNKWKIDENIYCQHVTNEYLEEALTLLDTSFYPYENICKTLELAKDPEVLKELRELTRTTAEDGVTLIAIDKSNNKVVGASFNKIQVRDNPVFENFAKSWKHKASKLIVAFMAHIDNLCNLFDHCQVDCIFELMFLVTLPEYRGKGIAKKLSEFSIEVGSSLAKGINAKRSLDGKELSLEPVPKIISSIFTTTATQKIGRKCGFEVAVEVPYAELEFGGLQFGDVAKTGTPSLTLEYRRL